MSSSVKVSTFTLAVVIRNPVKKMRRFLIILVCSLADVLTFHLEKRPYGRRLQILLAEEYRLGNLWDKPKAGCCLGLALLALSSFTVTAKNKN